jgi:hypothetical protein
MLSEKRAECYLPPGGSSAPKSASRRPSHPQRQQGPALTEPKACDKLYQSPRHVNHDGRVAQLGEHLLCKQGVAGSIPVTSTNFLFLLLLR